MKKMTGLVSSNWHSYKQSNSAIGNSNRNWTTDICVKPQTKDKLNAWILLELVLFSFSQYANQYVHLVLNKWCIKSRTLMYFQIHFNVCSLDIVDKNELCHGCVQWDMSAGHRKGLDIRKSDAGRLKMNGVSVIIVFDCYCSQSHVTR